MRDTTFHVLIQSKILRMVQMKSFRVGDPSVLQSAYLEFINSRYCLDCQEKERYENFHFDSICYEVVEATTTTTAKQNEEGWE